jgi:hypothetical protein
MYSALIFSHPSVEVPVETLKEVEVPVETLVEVSMPVERIVEQVVLLHS